MMKLPLTLLTAMLSLSALAGGKVISLSAPADGKTLVSAAFQKAIDEVSAAGGGTVKVPAGEYLVAMIRLKDGVTLELAKDAVLLASTNHLDYDPAPQTRGKIAVLTSNGAKNIAVIGEGTINGRGDACGYHEEGPNRWRLIHFRNSTGVRVEGIRLINSNYWTSFYDCCRKVVLRNLTIRSQTNFNNDGIDLEVADALVENCDIDSDDDAVCFKSGHPEFACTNVIVRNCTIASHCNCIKFGTATAGVFRDIDIHDCTLHTRHSPGRRDWRRWPAVESKDWAISGIALEMVDGGEMENVRVRNITVRGGVICPLFARLGTRAPRAKCLSREPTFLRNVLVENLRWADDRPENAARLPIVLSGIPNLPIQNLTLRNISVPFVAAGRPGDEKLTPKENEKCYPEAFMFGRLPSWGIFARHVHGLTLENVDLRLVNGGESRAKRFLSDVTLRDTDLVRRVHTEMGTINTGGREGCRVSTGNLFPMVARPWGFGGWTPQTRPDGTSRWFYDYNDERLCGIRYTRQPSPWIGDHAAWNFLPVTGEPAEDAKNRTSWYSHKTEHFGPDRYGVYLADYDVTAEIAPALHGAIATVTYPKSDRPGLVVNPFKDGSAALSPDGLTVTGFSVRNANHRGWGAPVKGRFVIRLSRKAVSSRKLKDGALYLAFAPTTKGDKVEMRLAVSLISDAQAAENLRETEGKTFATLASEARAEWNERLGRIRINSTDEAKLDTFYTCFFRTMLFPLALWERSAEGKIVHWSPSTGETLPGYYYGGTGFWDTFRALFPLMNFLAPEMNARMMEGLQNCWKECGWLPEWSSPGLSNCMIGNNSASVVADAWLSGVRGNFDINELWKAVEHGANNAHPKMTSVGRAGVKEYNEKGYVPRDIGIRESAARTLEYAYDDWCIAELAQAIGRPAEEVALYRKRSGNWRNVFDPARKIAVGRNSDGSFNKAFNPFAWGGDFTEGCALHYTWSVFHDVPGLMAAMGGAKAFESRLDEIFALPPIAECSAYGGVIHEAREMQIMNFGQYAHGNQPIQHAIYLYDWCGAWAKAQHWAREVMDRLYKAIPDGYCGDEDNGQTSAWYVWSALGMYPVCPGSGEYALGAPLFDRIEIDLPTAKTLTIAAPGAAERQPFSSVALSGKKADRPFVRRADLLKGGTLEFSR